MKRITGLIITSILVVALLITGCSTTSGITPTTIEPVTTTNPSTTLTDNLTDEQITGLKIAEDFIQNSSTFKFDGIEGSIALVKTEPSFSFSSSIPPDNSWSYTFEFQNRHPGYGDRTGQYLTEIIVTHHASIVVNMETDMVMTATCDDTWNMITEKDLPVIVRGIVVSGGDATPAGGPLDVPRTFVYKILKDEGFFVNVSYTAYPPSPTGDAARAKITLDFYGGEIRVGDKIDARGNLDKQSNTVVVAESGDFIKTSLRKSTVLGVLINIKDTTPPDSPEDTPRQYIFELLKEDGTYVNVSYTAKEDVGRSLYNATIQVGDYMKAVGTYDKSTNTVVAATEGDLIKTYDYRTKLGE